ncbi:DNA polymerase III subunit beta [Vulgatibacter incomptus]|uniref:Beta sliding clamp n=1 Tax=Vulgatibacter incomptus TaxID=1391653 RepID=A0A0K1PH29_9BACT|nr:DNA polymerase III subunit beta [Vulgatibacter incomptus]AKU92843.1 DNA polymerase III beta subunit [Vulgatibacter incomptus]
MELQIAVEELTKALYRAQGIVEKKAAMPILSNVLLEAASGSLKVTAFDMEVGVVSEHRAEVLKEGRTTVSARHLYDIAKMLPEPMVVLKQGQNHYLEIRCGASHFRIVGSPADDFPDLPLQTKVPFVTVRARQLLEMIERTSFAISTDDTRFNLNGVFFEPVANGGGARMVATDGHRLSLVERPVEGDFGLARGVIVPRKGMHELKRLLAEAGTEEVELGFAGNAAMLRRPGLSMIMQLVNGQFPEYAQVIPKESARTVQVNRVRFLETLKRVSLLSQDQVRTVKLEVGEAVLRVSSQNPDLGEAHEELAIDGTGANLQIGFNARYLIDVLTALPDEDVALELTDDLSPGVIHPAGDKTYTAVVMPVRI